MKILNRYIAATYSRMMVLCLSSFITIYLVIDFLEKINRFTRAHGSPYYIALFFLYKIPEIISQVMPLGVLMATLLSLGALSRNSEIVAMRGCGISLRKITSPILIIAFLLSLITFFSDEIVVANTSREMKYIQDVLIEGKSPNAFFRQDNIWYKERNLVMQAKLFNPSTQTLEGVTLWQITGGMHPSKRIEAEKCVWNGKSWMLKDAVTRYIVEGNIVRTARDANTPVDLGLRLSDLRILDKHADTIGFFKLKRYCKNLRKSGYDPTRYEALMHSKISLAFASFIMAFLGIPFVMKGGRSSGIAFGIGLSIIIGFAYYVTNSILLSFGQTGVLPPVIAAWAANFIFGASAIWLTMTLNN
jgi:lipopolysaccharide export system permease protein